MSDTTNIQWTDRTFNPWIGCTKVSAGCKNCYAENTTRARVLRSQGHETWGKGAKRSRTSAATWKKPAQWNAHIPMLCPDCGSLLEAKRQIGSGIPLIVDKCKCGSNNPPTESHSPRIFPSLCDWLDDEVPIEWLADFLKLVHDTPHLTWQLLTKRPENWYRRISEALIVANGGDPTDKDWFVKHGEDFPKNEFAYWLNDWTGGESIPKNIWIGVSCEDQPNADKRIPQLMEIPAVIRFLSCEPLLGPIDLDLVERNHKARDQIHWVIPGGESGPGARPCNVEWLLGIVNQCQEAGVEVFVKQLGAVSVCDNANMFDWPDDAVLQAYGEAFASCEAVLKDKKGGTMEEWPEQLRVREFPKAREGR